MPKDHLKNTCDGVRSTQYGTDEQKRLWGRELCMHTCSPTGTRLWQTWAQPLSCIQPRASQVDFWVMDGVDHGWCLLPVSSLIMYPLIFVIFPVSELIEITSDFWWYCDIFLLLLLLLEYMCLFWNESNVIKESFKDSSSVLHPFGSAMLIWHMFCNAKLPNFKRI